LATAQVPAVAIKDHILMLPEANKAHPWETAWSVEAMQVEEVRNNPSLGERRTAANIYVVFVLMFILLSRNFLLTFLHYVVDLN
jgi:hypothetical protein